MATLFCLKKWLPYFYLHDCISTMQQLYNPLQRTGMFASNNKNTKFQALFFQPIQFGPTV
jgi:hypothetical protein